MNRLKRWIAIHPVKALFAVLAVVIIGCWPLLRTADDPVHVPEGAEIIRWEWQNWGGTGESSRLRISADGHSEIVINTGESSPDSYLKPKAGWTGVVDPSGHYFGFRKVDPFPAADAKRMFAAALAAGIHELKTFSPKYHDGSGTLVTVVIKGKQTCTMVPEFSDADREAMPGNYKRYMAAKRILGDLRWEPVEPDTEPELEIATLEPLGSPDESDDSLIPPQLDIGALLGPKPGAVQIPSSKSNPSQAPGEGSGAPLALSDIEMIFLEYQSWGFFGEGSRLTVWRDGRSEITVYRGLSPRTGKPKPGWTVSPDDAGGTTLRKVNPYPKSKAKEMFNAALAAGILELKPFQASYTDGGGTVVGIQFDGYLRRITIPMFMDEDVAAMPANYARYNAVEKILGSFDADAVEVKPPGRNRKNGGEGTGRPPAAPKPPG